MNHETLHGGRLVAVTLQDGSSAEFKVRQLPLRDYEAALALLSDEIALTAFICGHEKAWADNLMPESYEALRVAAEEVNARGFFAYAGRQMVKLQAEVERNLTLMASLPPETVRQAVELASRLPSLKSPPASAR